MRSQAWFRIATACPLVLAATLVGCGGSSTSVEPAAPTITAEHIRAMPPEEADSLSTRQNLAQPRNIKLIRRF